jgi:DNA-binding Xre family transcriptional regulator
MSTCEIVTAPCPWRRSGGVRLRVAELCRQRGLVSRRGPTPGQPSVRGLVARTGLAPGQVSKLRRRPWELEHIGIRTLELLCRGLECEPGELFVWGDERPQRPKSHPSPAHTPPARDRAQRWQARWDRDHPAPPQPAANPVLPDWDENEEYLPPEQWRQLHPDEPLSPGGATPSGGDAYAPPEV